MTDKPTRWLQRYLAWRRPWEVGFWLAFLALQATFNTVTAGMDMARAGLSVAPWEVASWEWSSHLMWALLLPLVLWVLNRWPLRWGQLRRHLPWHLAASLLCSVLHVLGMVLVRSLVYAAHARHYDFGDWPREMAYEALKDVRSYAFIVGAILSYRLLLWRLQGEARWLAPPDSVPASGPAAPAVLPDWPERLLVKKLGKEFLLPTAEIEWVQAGGNYVNLHRQQHDYPLRSTLAAIEQRLDPSLFVRVHRSYLVNLSLVHSIEPTESGDALLRLRGGGSIPCSRTHLEALRQRLAPGAVRV